MAHVTKLGQAHETNEPLKAIPFEDATEWGRILGESYTNESALRRLIELHPEVLPWSELIESPRQVGVVCGGCSAAATDVLLLEQLEENDARFVIVETKLENNPEIRRTVLAQILEYAAMIMAGEAEETLNRKAEHYWAKERRLQFPDEMERRFGATWKERVWRPAIENLRKRNVRLLIVADYLPPSLRATVTFFPSDMLLAGVQVVVLPQPNGERVTVATVECASTGVGEINRTRERCFAHVRLSFATVQVLENGLVVSNAAGREVRTRATQRYTLEELKDNLETNTIALGILQELEKFGGKVEEHKASVGFKLRGRAGLVAKAESGKLKIALHADNLFKDDTNAKSQAQKLLKKATSSALESRIERDHWYWLIAPESSEKDAHALLSAIKKVYDDVAVGGVTGE